jgi:predicted  nucleic acid-binding Zn-ribbon protein
MLNLNKNFLMKKSFQKLYLLQLIDLEMDKLKIIQNNILKKKKNMKEKFFQFQQEIENINNEISNFKKESKIKKNDIKNYQFFIKELNIKIYQEIDDIEIEYLNKEIEYKKIEIKLTISEIQNIKEKIKKKKQEIEEVTEKMINKKYFFLKKKIKLNKILFKKINQESFLKKKYKDKIQKIKKKFLKKYKKIRDKFKNGLVIVTLKQRIIKGSYLIIPIQKYLKNLQKKIVLDEYSGRILINTNLIKKEKKKFINILFELKRYIKIFLII